MRTSRVAKRNSIHHRKNGGYDDDRSHRVYCVRTCVCVFKTICSQQPQGKLRNTMLFLSVAATKLVHGFHARYAIPLQHLQLGNALSLSLCATHSNGSRANNRTHSHINNNNEKKIAIKIYHIHRRNKNSVRTTTAHMNATPNKRNEWGEKKRTNRAQPTQHKYYDKSSLCRRETFFSVAACACVCARESLLSGPYIHQNECISATSNSWTFRFYIVRSPVRSSLSPTSVVHIHNIHIVLASLIPYILNSIC